MKKGSLVVLKHTQDVLWSAMQYALSGNPFPELNVAYVMATDIQEYKCEKCEEIHKALSLEEIPGVAYIAELFEEVQSVSEVNTKELLWGNTTM